MLGSKYFPQTAGVQILESKAGSGPQSSPVLLCLFKGCLQIISGHKGLFSSLTFSITCELKCSQPPRAITEVATRGCHVGSTSLFTSHSSTKERSYSSLVLLLRKTEATGSSNLPKGTWEGAGPECEPCSNPSALSTALPSR